MFEFEKVIKIIKEWLFNIKSIFQPEIVEEIPKATLSPRIFLDSASLASSSVTE